MRRVELEYDEQGASVVEVRAERELKPAKVRKSDALAFAERNNYSAQLARISWRSLAFTFKNRQKPDIYPALGVLNPLDSFGKPTKPNDLILDARKIQARLDASDRALSAWSEGTKAQIQFIDHFSREAVQQHELGVQEVQSRGGEPH